MGDKETTYKDSGVDIRKGEELVESIKEVVAETHHDRVLSKIGGFGGFYLPDLKGYDKPVLVSSVDGVGTKLIAAFKAEKYTTIGQDLVNHCVNDIAVCGAKPLFFLDYFSTGKLDTRVGYEVIKGFSIACKQNNVALIGGETAEMPDIYKTGEFDLAGTIVGIVDKDNIIDGKNIERGNLLVGFRSSGLHTNGYSLARKILFDEYDINDFVNEFEATVADELLKIHRSYLPLINDLKKINGVNGFSHITGGGIIGNTKRIVPDGLSISIDWDRWERPRVFKHIQELGNVPEDDMRATFNLGIGLIVIIDKKSLGILENLANKINEPIFKVGEIK